MIFDRKSIKSVSGRDSVKRMQESRREREKGKAEERKGDAERKRTLPKQKLLFPSFSLSRVINIRCQDASVQFVNI